MSEDAERDAVISKLELDLQPLFAELVIDAVNDVSEDVRCYGIAVAADLVKWVAMNASSDDETITRNLKHLKAQLTNLAVANHIRLHRAMVDKLDRILQTVIRIVVLSVSTAMTA